GKVKWQRNYDIALKLAKEQNKPLLLLFQEVPGCAGCRQFGQKTLSHPVIVKAMENEFIPLAIYNNAYGYDRKILERYKEPAWNFQVIRYLDHQGNDLIPRRDRIWTVPETAKRMNEALKAFGKPAPGYLQSVL
ncbi:MAG: thioredoxin family protein, partial [Verrucomicrobiota bacterium]